MVLFWCFAVCLALCVKTWLRLRHLERNFSMIQSEFHLNERKSSFLTKKAKKNTGNFNEDSLSITLLKRIKISFFFSYR